MLMKIRPSKEVLRTSSGTRRRTFSDKGRQHTLTFGKDPIYLRLGGSEVPPELARDPHLVVSIITEAQLAEAGGTVTPLAGDTPAAATVDELTPGDQTGGMGPNIRRLISTRLAGVAIPEGGGAADALAFLSKLDQDVVRDAVEWVRAAIAAVKTAPDNPFGDDDEAIAGELLRQVAAAEPAIAVAPAAAPAPKPKKERR